MHLRKAKRLAKVYLDKCVEVYGLSKFHDSSPYIDFESSLYSKYTKDDDTQAEWLHDYNTIVIYYKHMTDEKHLAQTIIHEYQHYLQSPSWYQRYYTMGYRYDNHPYEIAAFKEENNWKSVLNNKSYV
tara:strand:+ start:195 stop:578 length:384 start_codon:yes stop_codon:yes gene_type:complete